MAKKVIGQLKLQVKAGQANPSPPIGPALGQRGLNIMEFCKTFNARTAEMEQGAPVPVLITYYQDKSFALDIKTPATTYYLKKAAKIKSGTKTPGRTTAATVTRKQIREIAEAKMPDLSAQTVEDAMKIVLGSAKSMGIEVKG